MELLDLYTKNRERTGLVMSRGSMRPEGFYICVVTVCIFNSSGQMLIQRRDARKPGWPNRWDFSAGGCVISGENSQQAIERELYEELGIRHCFLDERPVLTIHIESGFNDMYTLNMNVRTADLHLQPEEVQATRWASRADIHSMIRDGRFIPYHDELVELLFYMRNHRGARRH